MKIETKRRAVFTLDAGDSSAIAELNPALDGLEIIADIGANNNVDLDPITDVETLGGSDPAAEMNSSEPSPTDEAEPAVLDFRSSSYASLTYIRP